MVPKEITVPYFPLAEMVIRKPVLWKCNDVLRFRFRLWKSFRFRIQTIVSTVFQQQKKVHEPQNRRIRDFSLWNSIQIRNIPRLGSGSKSYTNDLTIKIFDQISKKHNFGKETLRVNYLFLHNTCR